MFNLIITIIAIALVVVLTATSIFYGGEAFSNGAADAIAATFINQAQQVQAAATLFEAQNGGAPTTIAALSPEFLKTVPVAPGVGDLGGWTITGDVAHTGSVIGASNDNFGITAEVCAKINENGSGLVLCREAADAAAIATAVPFVEGDAEVGDSVRVYTAL